MLQKHTIKILFQKYWYTKRNNVNIFSIKFLYINIHVDFKNNLLVQNIVVNNVEIFHKLSFYDVAKSNMKYFQIVLKYLCHLFKLS